MGRRHELTGRYSGMHPINQDNTKMLMEISNETFELLKEHACRYYSNPTYDEVIRNLVQSYSSTKENGKK